ncbi:DUF58 domain-containing protein [Pseudoduganella umbonata]|uniref:DUF58 domain-containing protein n=1 Tax=Pseudoduganella umbonata TaxID=864828 RepID=A0A4P8HV61_9BURK|nr:DUF58 domain-containing protein [Pseudoduganella umbonata]MBB3223273.1 uncharacterized protein (DUF58 family) [Pseudoduganella umbonata]QCP13813.1 DUF58 domain-containing protein [Pseudoduganella umbonata]
MLEAFWRRVFRSDRRKARDGEVVLTLRRVYILPARAGLAFVVLLVLMLIGATNYALGLGFALTFLAASCAMADMVLTVKNLAGLRLAGGRAAPVFAGDAARFDIHLHNAGNAERYAIRVRFGTAGAAEHAADVPARGSAAVALAIPAPERGWLRAPRIHLETRFPLGLFRAWSWWQPDLRVLVYPHPESPAQPLPVRGAASEEGHGEVGLDNFAGIRSYQPGDPMRQLAWRQIARLVPEDGGHLVTKHFEGGAVAELALDFERLPAHLGVELRLARMTRWVLDAEQRALPYSFRLGSLRYAAGLGDAHRAACLQALALYGREAAP